MNMVHDEVESSFQECGLVMSLFIKLDIYNHGVQ